LRAERRAGGILAESTKRGGDRKSKLKLNDAILNDMSVTLDAVQSLPAIRE